MRDQPVIRTRQDLYRLIADAVRLHFRHVSQGEAVDAADTVLRALKAAGLSIRRKGAEAKPTWRR